MEKKYGALSSSVDPQKLAATVEGLIAMIGSLLVFFGVFSTATETTLLANVNQLITDVMILVPLISAMGGLCYTIFGLLRKAVIALQAVKSTGTITVAQEPAP